MGIQTTGTISRTFAIERIKKVLILINEDNYIELDNISFEPKGDVKLFIDSFKSYDIYAHKFDILEKWTNDMLEDIIDKPFFRMSMFDNYFVVNDGEEDDY